ncbi:hypothetical protein SUGI_0632390 [Cryptomeria japonica]|nr:hypothetical protein SUGI_0632390 [Cryptomeria japonica]
MGGKLNKSSSMGAITVEVAIATRRASPGGRWNLQKTKQTNCWFLRSPNRGAFFNGYSVERDFSAFSNGYGAEYDFYAI